MDIASIIEYEGDNKTFIWRHPCVDFNTMTQLVVHESQEAIFFMNGQALDSLGPGRHTLETQNIPILGKHLNRTVGDRTPFHCEVYFINKTEQMSIEWGTDTRLQYMDPTYNFPLSIGAHGDMSLRVEDGRKLLVKLVGTETSLEQQRLAGYFKDFLVSHVKSYMAQIIREQNLNIFELDARLVDFSQGIHALLKPNFSEYGMALERFFVSAIAKPDGDPLYEKFKNLHFQRIIDVALAEIRQQTELIQARTEAQKVVIDSQAQATKRAQEGYTYAQQRGFDVAQDAAKNEAVGQFTNMGIGVGTMTGVGGVVGGFVGNALNDAVNPATPVTAGADRFCDNCGAKLVPGAAFCDECGTAVPVDTTKCANCGYVFERPGKFCPKCGTKRG